MKTSEQLSSLFSHTDNESDYEEEKRIKKLKITIIFTYYNNLFFT